MQQMTRVQAVARMTRALLRDRGWIKVPELAKECEVSRATAYRYLDYLEAAGWPLERDLDTCESCKAHRRESRGVRSLLVGHQRQAAA